MSATGLQRLLDEAALRRTALLYARGADRQDRALWASLMTADCVLEGPGFTLAGRDAILASLDRLSAMYVACQHRVHNQTVEVDGDDASGETYCTADHVFVEDGCRKLLAWQIRYQDRWRREHGAWRFCRRVLMLDWQEQRDIE